MVSTQNGPFRCKPKTTITQKKKSINALPSNQCDTWSQERDSFLCKHSLTGVHDAPNCSVGEKPKAKVRSPPPPHTKARLVQPQTCFLNLYFAHFGGVQKPVGVPKAGPIAAPKPLSDRGAAPAASARRCWRHPSPGRPNPSLRWVHSINRFQSAWGFIHSFHQRIAHQFRSLSLSHLSLEGAHQ